MDINYKNILAGVGGMSLLMIIAILGLFTNANYFDDSSGPLAKTDYSFVDVVNSDANDCYSDTEYTEGGVLANGEFSNMVYDIRGRSIYVVDSQKNQIRNFFKDGKENTSAFPGKGHQFVYPISSIAIGLKDKNDKPVIYVAENNNKNYFWTEIGNPSKPKIGKFNDPREGGLWKFYLDFNDNSIEENLDLQNSNLNVDGLSQDNFLSFFPKHIPEHIVIGSNSKTALDTIFTNNVNMSFLEVQFYYERNRKNALFIAPSRSIALFNQKPNASDEFSEDSDNNMIKQGGNWEVVDKIFYDKNFHGVFFEILGIASDKSGDLYVLDRLAGDPSKRKLVYFDIDDGKYTGNSNTIFTTDIKLKKIKNDQNGNIYFLDSSGKIYKYVKGANQPQYMLTSIFADETYDFTVDDSGTIYVSGPEHIFKYYPKWTCGTITVVKKAEEKTQESKSKSDIFIFNKNFDKKSGTDFYIKKTNYSKFSLGDGSDPRFPSQITFKMAQNGVYRIYEDANLNFQKTKIECTDPSFNSGTSGNVNAPLEINLDNNEDIICTFVNTEIVADSPVKLLEE